MTDQNSKILVKIIKYPVIILFALLLGGSFHLFTVSVLGWADPAQSPPSGNAVKPINVGSAVQTKTGNLTIDSASDLTVGQNFHAGGKYIDFGETAQVIRDAGDYIAFGSSTVNMFNFFTRGSYAGRMAVGNPAVIAPNAVLRVDGSTAVTGAATTTGAFWMAGPANVCKRVSYTNISQFVNCNGNANYYVVAVGNSSTNRLVNPSAAPATGYMICCKNAD